MQRFLEIVLILVCVGLCVLLYRVGQLPNGRPESLLPSGGVVGVLPRALSGGDPGYVVRRLRRGRHGPRPGQLRCIYDVAL